MLLIVLIISILITIILLYKLKSFTKTFHWFELICVTLFCLAICSWNFNLYHSAYESLEVEAKYIEFFTAYVHFVIMYPLLIIWVLREIKQKRPIKTIALYAMFWLTGAILLLELDIALGAFKIKYGHFLPISIMTILNAFNLLSSIFFMKKFSKRLKKDGHVNG